MAKLKVVITNIVYILIIIPLLYIALSVVYQSIKKPEEIPSIFGYKLFMILDYEMEQVEYGDLVFTKNIEVEDIEDDDVIAVRDISENKVEIIKSEDYRRSSKLEGLLIKRIPEIGTVLYSIQKPINMIAISLIILTVGGIWIYIAGKLDERDLKNNGGQAQN